MALGNFVWNYTDDRVIIAANAEEATGYVRQYGYPMVSPYWDCWIIPVRVHHTLPGHLPAPPRYPWASLTYGTRGPKLGNNVKS
jgi:hypothetical protein